MAVTSPYNLLEAIPKGFAFPTQDQFVKSWGTALYDVKSLATETGQYDLLKDLPPVKSQIAACVATFESATGVSVEKVSGLVGAISSIVSAKKASDVVNAVIGLINGVVDVVSDVIGTVGAVASTIPIVGQAVAFLLKVLSFALEAIEERKQDRKDCEYKAANAARVLCEKYVKDSIPAATGASLTPADMFRSIAYHAADGKSTRPLGVASIYLDLCGDALPGVLQTGYYDEAVKKYSLPGIPRETRKKMWSLIRSILSAVENPNDLSFAAATGDSGVTSYSILLGMIYGEFETNKRIDGRVVEHIADRISDRWLVSHEAKVTCDEFSKGMRGDATCKEVMGRPLTSKQFLVALSGYRNQLRDSELFDKSTGKWRNPNQLKLIRPGAAKGILLLSNTIAKELSATNNKIEKTANESPILPWHLGVGALGLAGAGYLGYAGLKRLR